MYHNQPGDSKSPVKSQIPSVTSCTEKPQKLMKDIHGRKDGPYDAEPSLTVTELELLTAVSSHDDLSTAGSIADDCSSVNRGRLRRKEVLSQSSLTSSVFKTEPENQRRSRPVKPHEVEPFLQLDATTHGKRISLQHEDTSNNREKQRCVRAGLEARQTPAYSESHASAFCRPYSSPTSSLGSRSRYQRPPSNMHVSQNIPGPHPNIHVKTPFKHNIHKPREAEKTKLKSPSQSLKEMTAVATYHVSRILAAYSGDEGAQPTGHLLKGRLKPLYPVVVTGPKIEHCRGILSETRSYCPSASRTFQRRRQIMMQLKSGDRHISALSLCQQRGYDSVHRVSAASSAEDWVSNSGEEKESVEDDGDAEIEISEKQTCEITLEQFCQACPKEDKHSNKGEARILAMGDKTQLPLQTVIDENQDLPYLTQGEMHHSCSWKEQSEQSASWAQRNTSRAVSDPSSTETSDLATETSHMADKLSETAIRIPYMASDASEMAVETAILDHDQTESGNCATDQESQKCKLKKEPGGCVNDASDAVIDRLLSKPSHLFQDSQRNIEQRTSLQLWRVRQNHQPLISSVKTVRCPDLNLPVANSRVPLSRFHQRQMTEKEEKKKNGSQLTCQPKDRQKTFSDKRDEYDNSVPYRVPARSADSVNCGGQSGVGETTTCGGMIALFTDLQTPHQNKQCKESCEDRKLLSLTANMSQKCTCQQINGYGVEGICTAFLKVADDTDMVGLENRDFSCAADTLCTKSHTFCTKTCPKADKEHQVFSMQSEELDSSSENTQSARYVGRNALMCHKGSSCSSSRRAPDKKNLLKLLLEGAESGVESCASHSYEDNTSDFSSCVSSAESDFSQSVQHTFRQLSLTDTVVGDSGKTCENLCASFISSWEGKPGEMHSLCGTDLQRHPVGLRVDVGELSSCTADCLHETLAADCLHETLAADCLHETLAADCLHETLAADCLHGIVTGTELPMISRQSDKLLSLRLHGAHSKQEDVELTANEIMPDNSTQCVHNAICNDGKTGKVRNSEPLRHFLVPMDGSGRSSGLTAHCSQPASCLPHHASVKDKKKKSQSHSNKQHSTFASILKNIGKSENNSFISKCDVSLHNAVKVDPLKLDIKQRLNYNHPKSQVYHQTKGARKVFTHHSTHPFICPSNDSFSLSVARHLKFGDSPYLKELSVKTGRRTIRSSGGKEKSGGGKGGNVFNARCLISTSFPRLPDLQSSFNHHICCLSTVSFADCSSEMISVKQNCSGGEEPCGGDQSVLVSGQ